VQREALGLVLGAALGEALALAFELVQGEALWLVLEEALGLGSARSTGTSTWTFSGRSTRGGGMGESRGAALRIVLVLV
jgi:hypothetical protein